MRLITVFAGASAPPHHHTAKTRLFTPLEGNFEIVVQR
jgi:hypothetical protein